LGVAARFVGDLGGAGTCCPVVCCKEEGNDPFTGEAGTDDKSVPLEAFDEVEQNDWLELPDEDRDDCEDEDKEDDDTETDRFLLEPEKEKVEEP